MTKKQQPDSNARPQQLTAPNQLQALQDMARPSKVELTIHQIAKSTEIVAALDKAKATGAAAVNVLASPILFSNRQIIMKHVAMLGLPAMYQWPETEESGFAGYGPRIVSLWQELMTRQSCQNPPRRETC